MRLRFRNPRCVMRGQLSEIKATAAALFKRLTVSSTVYTETGTRRRRPDEYPENRTGDMERLYRDILELEGMVAALRETAEERFRGLLNGAGPV
jgi:hypothetical protein